MIEKIPDGTIKAIRQFALDNSPQDIAFSAIFTVADKINEIVEVVNGLERKGQSMYVTCPRCKGKGFIGVEMNFETVCNNCTGTGVWQW